MIGSGPPYTLEDMDITVPEKEIHQFVLRVACGEEGLKSIYRWLKDNTSLAEQ